MDNISSLKLLIKISTKNQFENLMSTWQKYVNNVQDIENTHFLISLEKSDPLVSIIYNNLKNLPNTTIVIGSSESRIDSINRDINEFSKLNHWDVLLVSTTDVYPLKYGFDQTIRSKFLTAGTLDLALFFNEGYGDTVNRVPIIGKSYYERFGCVYHNKYHFDFCEEEYTEVGRKLGKLVYFDEQIIRKENPEEYDQDDIYELDKNTYEKRIGQLEAIPRVISPKYRRDYQYPGTTERQALHNHLSLFGNNSSKNIYIGFPWASLIDDFSYVPYRKYLKPIDDLKSKIDHYKQMANGFGKEVRVHTVCQHIRWRYLLDMWSEAGIDDVYISHCTKDIKEKINIHPWTLSAANTENKTYNSGLVFIPARMKKHFFSFIGNHCSNYRSEIRPIIKSIVERKKPKNIVFSLDGTWFFQDLVYKEQLKNKYLESHDYDNLIEKTKTYNETISNSLFSLCPEGSGPNTIRLWESMSVGSIPVLFENDWLAPEITDLNWNDFSVTIPKTETENFIEILKDIPMERIELMQYNCLNAYSKFRLMTCFN